MILISIIAGFILFFSFIGGFMQGAVKSFFSLVSFIVAVPIAAHFYTYIADLLSFLNSRNWENFLGFFITLGIVSIILHFIFFLPRRIMDKAWPHGVFNRFLGGVLNLLSAAIGLVVFAIVLTEYPIWDWLYRAVAGSAVIDWLVSTLSFVRYFFP